MTQASDKPRHSLLVAIVLTVVVGAIATAVIYLVVLKTPQAPVAPSPGPIVDANLPVQTVVLPHDDLDLPPGPYQRTFATSCTICHSPRLVMTQPPFPRKTWAEEVHKMVKTYGAPVSPEAEEQITDYLTTVRGE